MNLNEISKEYKNEYWSMALDKYGWLNLIGITDEHKLNIMNEMKQLIDIEK